MAWRSGSVTAARAEDMMSETPIRKKVDESWKEQVEQEKKHQIPPVSPPLGSPASPPPRAVATSTAAPSPSATQPAAAAGGEEGGLEARFDLFVSSMAMEALIGLGDAPHPTTRKTSTNLPQARYVIDLLGMLSEKTKGNLSVDEERMLKDVLYQLRMRYLAKSGGGPSA